MTAPTAPTPPTPPASPTPPAPRRILRSRSDRIVAGVAAGFGRYVGVDPVLIRLALVLLTFVGGIGALVYLLAWLIVPEEPADEHGGPPATRPRIPLWLMAFVLVGLVFSGGIGRIGLGLRSDVLWPLILVIAGVAVLWMRTRSATGDGGGDAEPSWVVPVAPAEAGAGTVLAPGAIPTGGADAEPDPAPEADRVGTEGTPDLPDVDATWPGRVAATRELDAVATPVRRSPVRRAAPVLLRLVLALLAAAAGFALAAAAVVVLEGPGDLVVTTLEVVVVSLLLVAAAVGAGRRWHRTPDLLLVAVAVIVVLVFAAWLRPPLHGGYGSRDIRPADTVTAGPYELAAGRLRIDLGEATRTPRTVTASIGVGLLEVIVPDDAVVTLDAHVGGGELCAFDLHDRGTDISRRTAAPAGSARPLHLRARVGLGSVVVVRNADRESVGCTAAAATPAAPPASSPTGTPTPTPTLAPLSST